MSLSSLSRYPLDLRTRAPVIAPTPSSDPRQQGRRRGWNSLSRRRMLQSASAAGVLAVGGAFSRPRLTRAAQTDGVMPKPVPGGIDVGGGNIIHVYEPKQGAEPSTITDFRGFVGIQHIQGEGTVATGGGGGGMSTPTATGDRLLFDADMRFMMGQYVGEDGQEHTGTFAFV